jgi:hypothetical protein
MSYFNKFQRVQYDLDGQGDYSLFTDITPNFKIRNSKLVNSVSYLNHTISDEERPDVTSTILYGSSQYHWTFFIVNDHLRNGHSVWPLSQHELESYMHKRYDPYACITMDPISPPQLIGGSRYGNPSYIPFGKKYSSIMFLQPVNEYGADVPMRAQIIEYDYQTAQMVISRNINNSFGVGTITPSHFVERYPYYKIVVHAETAAEEALAEDFKAVVAAAYGVSDVNEPLTYRYRIALDDDNNRLAWELLRNASYMYYETDAISGGQTILNGYDIIARGKLQFSDGEYQSVNFSTISRITYAEKEALENDRKRSIQVINPKNINNFAESYFKVLSNG